MSPEEFLKLIDPNYDSRASAGARLRHIRLCYEKYRRAYTSVSLEDLCWQAHAVRYTYWPGLLQAAQDRDAGRPMIEIPELLEVKP